MPAVAVEKEAWTDQHTASHHLSACLILLRKMVAQTLASRSTFYTVPELAGVAEHGGDRISSKVKQLLNKLCAAVNMPEAKGMVEEEVKNNRATKAPGTPRKGGGSPKKRKVKDEDEEED